MKDTTSLCITYPHKIYKRDSDPNDLPARVDHRLYRIADYYNSMFHPIEKNEFNDESDSFSPKYIRVRPGDEEVLTMPVIRNWHAIEYGDGKLSTESYKENGITFFEAIVIPELINNDDAIIAKMLLNGIEIEDEVADNLLIAIWQDNDSYTMIQCSKKSLKRNGVYLKLDTNINDPIYGVHGFKTYIIDKKDLFSTADFNYLYKDVETKELANTRYFYKYSKLPETDGIFNIFGAIDYLQLLVRKYLKANAKILQYTNSERQKILELIDDSLNNSEEMDSIVKNSGYTKDALLNEFEKERNLLSEIIRQDDSFGKVVLSIFKNDEQINQQYLQIAKKEWSEEKSNEKKAIEDEIISIKEKNDELLSIYKSTEEKINKQKKKNSELEKENDNLNHQKESIISEIKNALSDFNSYIGKFLVNNSINSNISNDNGYSLKIEDNILIREHEIDDSLVINEVDDPEMAIYIMRNNLSSIGIKTECAISIAKLIYSERKGPKSFVINGNIARAFSDAIAYALDGKKSTVVTTPSTINYKYLNDRLSNIKGNVILFENIIDSCNELDYMNIVKDFPEKLLIFSVDNPDSLSLLSKNIWYYSIPVIVGPIFDRSSIGKNHIFAKSNKIVRKVSAPVSIGIESYDDVLSTLSLPQDVCEAYCFALSAIENYNEKIESISKELVDSIYAFFCSLYIAEIDETDLEKVKMSLSECVKNYYRW